MVFSSVPLYHLDPPNWQQQPNEQQQGGTSNENPQLPPPPPIGGGGASSIRPNSMAERARLAKIPQPEAALKCPRCESTNTKFCYFNNYSLSQPRHFCKTCRRYWTRGGALRNVPVGGGCRRNKRSKGRRSKSPVKAVQRQVPSSSNNSSAAYNHNIINHLTPPQLPFLPPLHNLNDFGSPNIGLNFGGIRPSVAPSGSQVEFQVGNTSINQSARFAEQWRLQQFSFLSGLETPSGQNYTGMEGSSKELDTAATEMGSVKAEENQGLNMSRNFLSVSGNDQYWGGNINAWTDLSGYTSSTSHLL